MSTKPATVPTWDSNHTNEVAVTGGHGTDGWAVNEVPTSSELNNWMRRLTDWTQYLSDGAFQGASTFNSTVGITGATTVGGTLGVTGLTTATGGVTAGALITANAGVTAGANQHITISGTGRYKYGSIVYPVTIYGPWWILTGSQAVAQQSGNTAHKADFVTAGTPIGASIPLIGLTAGTRIINVRAVIKDVSGQTAFRLSLYGADKAGSAALQGSTQVSAASGATQTLTISAVNFTVGTTTTGDAYLHFNTVINATGTYEIFSIELDIDFP